MAAGLCKISPGPSVTVLRLIDPNRAPPQTTEANQPRLDAENAGTFVLAKKKSTAHT